MKGQAAGGVTCRRTAPFRIASYWQECVVKPQAFAFGASPKVLPAFFIWASKALRAVFQVLSLRGTSQPPSPLQEFCPGYSPQPPWPLQALSPLQECLSASEQLPMPAQELPPPVPLPLQVLRPRQTCLSPNN